MVEPIISYMYQGLNNTLEIGTKEYNRIRYPYEEGRTPLWKKALRKDLHKKEIGEWRYGTKQHPAKTSLINDISYCIAQGIPLKTKSFEFKPVDASIHLYGEYVGRWGPEGRLGSFTLRNIDDKYTRYRLRDFGVELVSIKSKTYWKIRAGTEYFDYLLAIYGDVISMERTLGGLFSSIKVKNPDLDSRYSYYTLFCELKSELEYPTLFPTLLVFETYPNIQPFSHSSRILSHRYREYENGNIEGIRYDRGSVEYYDGHFEDCIDLILDMKDSEHRLFNFRILFKAVFSNPEFVLSFFPNANFHKPATFFRNDILFKFNLQDRYLTLQRGAMLLSYSFEELDIGEYFTNYGVVLKFVSEKLLCGMVSGHHGKSSCIQVLSPDRSLKRDLPRNANLSIIYAFPLLGRELLLGCKNEE